MSVNTTFAIIGLTESRGFSLIKHIAAKYPVLLFDKDEAKLSTALQQILTAFPSAKAEIMLCAADASWEADIILVTGYCCADSAIAAKIEKVSTGKIVIIISDENNDDIFSNPAGKLQQLLPYSKVVQVFVAGSRFSTDAGKELVVEGSDASALAAVASIFSSIGLTSVTSSTHSFNN